MIDFTYDNRNRLIEEHRTGTNFYWYAYTYDMAGNRKTKVQKLGSGLPVMTTTYTYDVDDPDTYGSPFGGSQGNRLMLQETRDGQFMPCIIFAGADGQAIR